MLTATRVVDTRAAVATLAAVDTWLVEVGTEEAVDVGAAPHTSLVVVDTGTEVDILTPPDRRQPDIPEGVAI